MPHTMISERDRKRDEEPGVVRPLFERVYSKGELGLATELVAADVRGYCTALAETYRGREGVKRHVSRLRSAFLGFTLDIRSLNVDSDTFEVCWTARGTHERRFLGVEPTCIIGRAGEEPHGPRIAVEGVATGTLVRGTIRDLEMDWDVSTLRRQLGSPVDDPTAAEPGDSPGENRPTEARRRPEVSHQ